ncbi:MAG: lysylphosphatidylglycerol synthase transmembrane domain-containing protein [Alphaproteobacteria bacterium]
MQKQLLTLAKLIVSLSLIAWVLNGIDTAEVTAKLSQARGGWLAVAMAFFVVVLMAGTVRWQLMLRGLGVTLGIGTTLRLFLVGMFFNQTLPSSIGGDATRVFYLWRAGTDAQTALNSVLLDRIVGLSILVVVTTLVTPTLFANLDSPLAAHGLVLVLAGSWTAIVMLFLFNNPYTRRFQHLRLIDFAVTLSRDAVNICRQRAVIVPAVLISVAIHGATIAIAWSLDRALGGTGSILVFVIVVTPTILLISIPVSIAGWGVREQIMVVLLGAFAIGAAQAVSVSILFGILLLVGGIPGGVLWLTMKKAQANPSVAEID